MAIYVTGDIHGNPDRLNEESFYEQKEMELIKKEGKDPQEENYVIILGDFGIIWEEELNKEEEKLLDWLEKRPFTTLFIDGNHENHKRLGEYPIKEWKKGKVHEIRPHVLHLMRGEVFEIDGCKIFSIGGASSHDISDGIIEYNKEDIESLYKQIEEMHKQGKYMYRVKGLSWWEEELPNNKEYRNGIKNLDKNGFKVDYILSHSPSSTEIRLMRAGMLYDIDELTEYIDDIKAKTEYKKHIFGHMHVDRAINEKDICIYEQIHRIW